MLSNMHPHRYFVNALHDRMYTKKAWVMRTFMIPADLKPLPESVDPDAQPYTLYLYEGKYAFFNPRNGNEPTVIEPSNILEPVVYDNEEILIDKTTIPNYTGPKTTTSCGTLFYNYLCLVYAFGNKVPYQEGPVNLGKVESGISKRVVDEVPDELKEPGNVYVSELKRYIKATMSIGGYSLMTVPSATPFTMTPAPGIHQLRDELIEKHKHEIHIPAVVAKIGKILEDYDREYLALDPDKGFIQSSKMVEIVRKKLFSMHGLESGFDEANPAFIPTSLSEGWDIDNLPAYANAQRDGSFSRGAETALGGEKTKSVFRVTTGSRISEGDCGTTLGIPRVLTETNQKLYLGSNIVPAGGSKVIELNEGNVSSYLGKAILVRSPAFCKAKDGSYCQTCMGSFVDDRPNAIATLAATATSTLMLLKMKAMHGKALKTVPIDLDRCLS